MKTYTTQQGDMWDSIALSQYGTVSAMNRLMAANTQYIGTYIFPSGIALSIPDIEINELAAVALPPWKQVV